MKHKNAFTLIELLVVISVLVVLIRFGIPQIKAMQQNGMVLQAQKETASITAALESYRTFDATHNYPPSTSTLQADYLINQNPKLISHILYDPFGSTSTTEYNYLCSGNKKYFVVYSVGLAGENQPTAISNTGVITY